MYVSFRPHSQLAGAIFYTITVQWKFVLKRKCALTNMVATNYLCVLST